MIDAEMPTVATSTESLEASIKPMPLISSETPSPELSPPGARAPSESCPGVEHEDVCVLPGSMLDKASDHILSTVTGIKTSSSTADGGAAEDQRIKDRVKDFLTMRTMGDTAGVEVESDGASNGSVDSDAADVGDSWASGEKKQDKQAEHPSATETLVSETPPETPPRSPPPTATTGETHAWADAISGNPVALVKQCDEYIDRASFEVQRVVRKIHQTRLYVANMGGPVNPDSELRDMRLAYLTLLEKQRSVMHGIPDELPAAVVVANVNGHRAVWWSHSEELVGAFLCAFYKDSNEPALKTISSALPVLLSHLQRNRFRSKSIAAKKNKPEDEHQLVLYYSQPEGVSPALAAWEVRCVMRVQDVQEASTMKAQTAAVNTLVAELTAWAKKVGSLQRRLGEKHRAELESVVNEVLSDIPPEIANRLCEAVASPLGDLPREILEVKEVVEQYSEQLKHSARESTETSLRVSDYFMGFCSSDHRPRIFGSDVSRPPCDANIDFGSLLVQYWSPSNADERSPEQWMGDSNLVTLREFVCVRKELARVKERLLSTLRKHVEEDKKHELEKVLAEKKNSKLRDDLRACTQKLKESDVEHQKKLEHLHESNDQILREMERTHKSEMHTIKQKLSTNMQKSVSSLNARLATAERERDEEKRRHDETLRVIAANRDEKIAQELNEAELKLEAEKVKCEEMTEKFYLVNSQCDALREENKKMKSRLDFTEVLLRQDADAARDRISELSKSLNDAAEAQASAEGRVVWHQERADEAERLLDETRRKVEKLTARIDELETTHAPKEERTADANPIEEEDDPPKIITPSGDKGGGTDEVCSELQHQEATDTGTDIAQCPRPSPVQLPVEPPCTSPSFTGTPGDSQMFVPVPQHAMQGNAHNITACAVYPYAQYSGPYGVSGMGTSGMGMTTSNDNVYCQQYGGWWAAEGALPMSPPPTPQSHQDMSTMVAEAVAAQLAAMGITMPHAPHMVGASGQGGHCQINTASTTNTWQMGAPAKGAPGRGSWSGKGVGGGGRGSGRGSRGKGGFF